MKLIFVFVIASFVSGCTIDMTSREQCRNGILYYSNGYKTGLTVAVDANGKPIGCGQ